MVENVALDVASLPRVDLEPVVSRLEGLEATAMGLASGPAVQALQTQLEALSQEVGELPRPALEPFTERLTALEQLAAGLVGDVATMPRLRAVRARRPT